MRKLITGKKVKEQKKESKIIFVTKCPAKWVHVDCENSQVYVSNWLKPTLDQLNAAIVCLRHEIKYITER